MKTKSLFLLIFCLGLHLVFCCGAKADGKDEGHGHKGEHGGYFADADDIYHFEFLLYPDGMLKVYLYDEKAEPMLVNHIPARWKLAPDNAYPLQGDFKIAPYGEYYFVKFPKHNSQTLHLQVEAKKGEEWIGLEYFLPVMTDSGVVPAEDKP